MKPKMQVTYTPKLTLGIEWNIDPIKVNGRETGEVQIWADVGYKDASRIIHAVNSHEELLKAAKNLLLGDNAFHVAHRKALEMAIAKAEGKPK